MDLGFNVHLGDTSQFNFATKDKVRNFFLITRVGAGLFNFIKNSITGNEC